MCSQIISTVKIPLYNSLLQPETNRHICERGFALFNSKGNFFFQTAVYLFRLPRLLTGAGIGPAQQRSISKLEVTVQLRRASRPFIRLRGKQHMATYAVSHCSLVRGPPFRIWSPRDDFTVPGGDVQALAYEP